MQAITVRRSLLRAFMLLTLMVGLITGLAYTKTAALPQRTGIQTIQGKVAGWCPPPPIVCSPIQ